jgi:hypothetical protein
MGGALLRKLHRQTQGRGRETLWRSWLFWSPRECNQCYMLYAQVDITEKHFLSGERSKWGGQEGDWRALTPHDKTWHHSESQMLAICLIINSLQKENSHKVCQQMLSSGNGQRIHFKGLSWSALSPCITIISQINLLEKFNEYHYVSGPVTRCLGCVSKKPTIDPCLRGWRYQ